MRVSTKLTAGFVLPIGLLAGVLAYHMTVLRDAVETSQRLATSRTRLTLSSTRQLQRLDVIGESTRKFLVTRDPRYLSRATDARAAYGRSLTRLGSLALEGREAREVERLSAIWEGMANIRMADFAGPGGDSLRVATLEPLLTALAAQTRRVNRAADAAVVEESRASAAAAERVEDVSWMAVAAALLLSVIVAALVVRSISGGLGLLEGGTEAVASGDFSHRIDPDLDFEFARLARDFNAMTERLGELDQAKKDFLSHVSHELKTPLASMAEANKLLLEELAGPLTPRQRRLLSLNLTNGRRLSSMISRLLDLSHMESGSMGYDFRQHDMRELAVIVLEEFSAGREERDRRVRELLPPEPVVAECDGDRVIQVMENLVGNALKYGGTAAPVQVSVRQVGEAPAAAVSSAPWLRGASDGGFVLVSVTDRGPGVPDADKERIFERFYRGDAGTGRGVGLGLPLSRQIVDAHGGHLWVTDRSGGGSVFRFLLPRAPVGVPGTVAADPDREAREGVPA